MATEPTTSTVPHRPSIVSVRKLLTTPNLQIPDYQRPYKWTAKHVGQLLDDVLHHHGSQKSAYRLGTVVLHQEKNGDLNLVDGQQRTVTLGLLARALHEQHAATNPAVASLRGALGHLTFGSAVSHENLRRNYHEIQRRIGEFATAIDFLLDRCQVVVVTLDDLSEAFQLFDSQNARGKDLAPHDLLKAFHLREMRHLPGADRLAAVQPWEATDQQELVKVFSEYLFRVRKWSKGESARQFTKADVDVFKGISPHEPSRYPYDRLPRYAGAYVDIYHAHYDQHLDGHQLPYPFQLDQVVVNGQRFFELVAHYQAQLAAVCRFDELRKQVPPGSQASRLLQRLDGDEYDEMPDEKYEGRYRIGDRYVRALFECALLYYVDRFGYQELDRAIQVLFAWAYRLRLEKQSVQLASIDNHALDGVRMFRLIREAVRPADVLHVALPPVAQVKATKVGALVTLLKGMNRYE